ncbi:MAG: FtsW/RodA/SpoVE family cell cycle protein, partial [Planctomycetes bacterium]|nr:FtsW/RodA/SpoVE family cell cycle protein [Planctomycetota bacterium]
RKGACRWYSIGPISIQPSEAMKYLVVIVLATYFTYTDRLSRFRDLIIPLALTFAPMILIIGQPDLGTSLLFLPTFLAVAFLALVPIRNLVFLITGGVLFAATMWFTPGALKDYQKQRVISFIDPRISPHSPASYNARQATIAVAGGGFEGQGWGRGVLNRLKRVPERHTDFIFPVIAEEWGFVKTSAVVVFYLMVLLMLARIAPQTPDTFGRLLVGGIMAVFGFQCLLHIAISLRLAPITGLTLPLMSYGGSSMISTFAAFGLVSSVAMRRDVIFSDRPTESKSLAETVASHPGV